MSAPLLSQVRFLVALNADDQLPPTAKVVAAALVLKFRNGKTGRCDPSTSALCEAAGLTRKATVVEAVRALEREGWIAVDRRGGRSRTNSFTVLFERAETVRKTAPNDEPETVRESAPFEAEETVRETDPFEGVKGTDFDRKGTQNRPRTYEEPSCPNGQEEEEERASARAPDGAAQFEEFWRHYPWKVGRGDARAEFERILAQGTATAGDILAGVMRYAAVAEIGRMAAPTKWLKAERWTDAAPQPSARQRRSAAKPSLAEMCFKQGGHL